MAYPQKRTLDYSYLAFPQAQGAKADTAFNGAGGARFFGGVMASSITVTEIKA